MAVFEFRGVEVATGKAVKGFRDAENPKTLRMVLRREGVMLTQATEESERKEKDRRKIDLFAVFKRPGAGDVAIMTRQLATLVRAGVPLLESISALTEQIENEQLVRILTNVRERLAVIYGDQYQLHLTSEPGRGTSARIEVPELTAVHQITA